MRYDFMNDFYIFILGFSIVAILFVISMASTYNVNVGKTIRLDSIEIQKMIYNKSIECPKVIEAYQCCGYTTLYCQKFPFIHYYQVSGAIKNYNRLVNGFDSNNIHENVETSD
jgi:hypothetical protein